MVLAAAARNKTHEPVAQGRGEGKAMKE